MSEQSGKLGQVWEEEAERGNAGEWGACVAVEWRLYDTHVGCKSGNGFHSQTEHGENQPSSLGMWSWAHKILPFVCNPELERTLHIIIALLHFSRYLP